MKALYPPLSYTLFIVISIAALSIILIIVNTFSENIQRNYAYGQLNYIAEVIRQDILKLYSTNAEGRLELSIPKDIIGKQYLIELDQKNLKLSLEFKDERIEVERFINTSASLSGRFFAPVSIEMNKTNGDISIKLV
ncbi:MAG: hypothetical protein GTN40_03815 [Candidatus Aenigmarchaeota archaeon]|nr:hypothetical protein [Candidatus Aenigmarchaeota archaeon]